MLRMVLSFTYTLDGYNSKCQDIYTSEVDLRQKVDMEYAWMDEWMV